MKEDAVQMMSGATPSGWSMADDTHPVISRTGLSEVLVEPLRQAGEQPTALGWNQEEATEGAFENLSLLERNPYSIVNVTREYPFECAMIMFGYIMPFVLVITLITNSLVIIVLSQRHMRTPTNLVLMTMAMVDIGTMASPSPWYLYIYTFGNHDKFLFPPVTCYAHYVMTDVIPIFLHTSSIWLALLLASQRYIYVCHPTLARTWCTKPRVKKAIYIILLVAFLHQLTHFFDNTFQPTLVRQNGRIQSACRNEMATWVIKLGDTYYYLTYFTFRIFSVFIIPCTALLTLNILLFRALRRAEKRRTELLKRKFKLVGVKAAEGLHHAVSRQRPRLKTNNFSTYDPSSYALAPAFATDCEKPDSCSEGAARASLSAPAVSVADDTSYRSLAEREGRGKKSSVELETDGSPMGRLSSSSSREMEVEDEESEAGDESTCAECAALRHSRASPPPCRRCSLDDTETTTARERHLQQHPSSQCSSIMGGATNEEDVSSLTTNQHHHRCPNGSVFGRSEGGERRSNLEDSDQEAELNFSLNSSASGQHSVSAEQQSERIGKDLANEKVDEAGLIKSSSSAESRLAHCGCLTAHTRALRRSRTLNKSKLRCGKAEPGCCPVGRLSLIEKAHQSSSESRLQDDPNSKTPAGHLNISTTAGAQANGEASKLVDGDGPSFVQVRVESHQQEWKDSERRSSYCNNHLFAPVGRRIKSPSFASSIGRASRASLAGSTAVAPALTLAPSASHQQQSGRTMDSNRTTLMLIVVVTVFLIVEVPVAVVTIIHVVLNMFEAFHNVDINGTLNYIKLFTNFFIMLSYSINFTIYCSMSKKFRETFRDLFCWGKFRRKRSARLMYQTQAQPNEYATVTLAPGGVGATSTHGTFDSHRPLALAPSFVPTQKLAKGRSLVDSSNLHQRSNSLKPVKLYGNPEGYSGANGRVQERQQCGGTMCSDYLATATTTLTTLEPRGSTAGQQQATNNGRL